MSGVNADLFRRLTAALHQAGCGQPTLVIDKQALDHNVAALNTVTARGFDYRIVAKSLPSPGLIRYLMEKTGTNRLMSFHLPFILEAARHFPDSDILLGKPMPVVAAKRFYDRLGTQAGRFDPARQLQWLIDSEDRLREYAALADQLGCHMRISLEIDIGLHRGGFRDMVAFRRSLEFILGHERLTLSGLMGYDAHVSKIPGFLGGLDKAFTAAAEDYARHVDLVREVFGEAATGAMVFNTGGSTTYPLYQTPGPANELSTASALVQPTDFDVPTLAHHQPAAFIAAPVLKTVEAPEIPMAPRLSAVLRQIGVMPRRACFIYGGNWLAQPVWPAGARFSKTFGHSSNQEMYDLPKDATVSVNDFLFFRPAQSEAVFLQFGDIALVDGDTVSEWWPVFDAGHV